MRYLSSAVFVAVAGSVSAFACGGDSGNVSAGTGGKGGASAQGGIGGASPNGGSPGKGGSAGSSGSVGKGGSSGSGGSGGTGDLAGAPTAGDAGQSAGGEAGAGGAAGEQQAPDTLKVTITGVPAGKTADVTVTGPGSFSQSISATTTFDNLEAGSYAVSAPTIPVSGTQVDSIFEATITGSPADVQLDAASAVDVAYAQRPGTGMMWVTNFSTHNAFGFDATALANTGAQDTAPSVALTLAQVGTNAPPTAALAFSATNDLWVGSCRNTQTPQVLAKFSSAKLGANGAPTPDVTLTLPSPDASYDCVGALAFDSSGNLWVGMYHGHILRFDASDLAASGTPAPSVTLSSNTTYFALLLDMVFDSAGNLYVAPYGNHLIPRLSASQLSTSNANVVPDVALALATGVGPGGLAIGSDGGLWISDYKNSAILKLGASSLDTSGSPTPALSVTGVAGPEQLAFDKAGNLWVAAYDSNNIVAIAAADLATGGAKTPLTTLAGGGVLNGTFGLRFNP